MLPGIRRLLVPLVLAPLCALSAQDTITATPPPVRRPIADSARCGFCPRPNVPVALFEGLLVTAVINRANAWILHDSTAYVNARTWRKNFRDGWGWDADAFMVNMFGHPYMGSTYFAAARTNGLGFWAGVPITVVQAAGWEYFGETTQPSVNDIVNTSMGGIALGEMFHRVAATIRDNERSGGARLFREIVAFPFDPVGGVNRLVRGEWSRRGPNPVEHNPVGTVVRIGGGAGVVRPPGSSPISLNLDGAKFSSILFADLKYGDAYLDTLRKPFDAFSMRMLVAPAHGGLTQLVGVGRIAGKEIGGGERQRRQLELNQRFEYVNNQALQFGAQSLQLAVTTRTHIVEYFWVRTLIAADAIVLSGINAPGAGTGPRTYDFGPGVGATATASIERGTDPILTVRYQPAYTRTISGADADHFIAFASIEASIPVLSQASLVVQGSYFKRTSRYSDGSSNRFSVPELRVFATFKTPRSRGGGQ